MTTETARTCDRETAFPGRQPCSRPAIVRVNRHRLCSPCWLGWQVYHDTEIEFLDRPT